jgi:hypothetical protein
MATKRKPAPKTAPAKKVKAGKAEETKKPETRGRPSGFSEVLGDTICERLANGESLRAICTGDDMPSQSMVFRWLAQDDVFREQYTRAREAQADVLADETIAIADDGRNDWMERHGRDGESIGWQVNGEAVSRSKLRVEARKWFASKLAPKKYGEKIAVGGAEDLPPIQSTYEMSTEALLAIAAQGKAA